MMQQFKAKVAHILDNGDKLEMEAHVEAKGHDMAFDQARQRFQDAIGKLATSASIDVVQSKIELKGS